MSGFERLLYRLVNRVVGLMLRSPSHGLVSGRILLLTFLGRKSGRSLVVPLGYVLVDGSIVCFTGPAWSAWWKNLRGGAPVATWVGGKCLKGTARVATGAEAVAGLGTFLRAFPRTAARYGVGLDARGLPHQESIEAAVRCGRVVMVSIRPH